MNNLIDKELADKLWQSIVNAYEPNDVNLPKFAQVRIDFINATGWEPEVEEGKWVLV